VDGSCEVCLIICLVLLLGMTIYFLAHNPYRDFAALQLAGEIDCIIYQPNVSGDEVKIRTDR